jgi:hypothetical protein
MAKVERLVTQPDGRILPMLVEEEEANPPEPPPPPSLRKPMPPRGPKTAPRGRTVRPHK